jgi:hypothetical protein
MKRVWNYNEGGWEEDRRCDMRYHENVIIVNLGELRYGKEYVSKSIEKVYAVD